MELRFVWADGQLGFASPYGRVHHQQILQNMLQRGQVQKPVRQYVGGYFKQDDLHGPAFDKVSIIWEYGDNLPTLDQLKFWIEQELNRTSRLAIYKATVEKLGATTEDTEPKGAEVGFLHDPHKELYPNLFKGGNTIPPDVKETLKNHVLEPLSKEFTDPDSFIYFTVYGSGISYNWDETGDLDLQLWVDIEKYSATTDEPLSSDDLLADIRRIVSPINFPTFAELGLAAPENSPEDTTGAMMIQYYPKPGKGTKDENIASKPYACYDLETDKWLVKPKPMKPKFYGDNFLLLMPKAKDIALQSEALIGEYTRNILNWQFWFAMYQRYRNPKYREIYRQAMQDATQEREGIKVLFEGVFGGRAEAYSPEGKGIYDERDILQKLLEVWGVFQDLKHYARSRLPWEEQEMPLPKGLTSKWKLAALNGLPPKAFGPNEHIQQSAQEYMNKANLAYQPPQQYLKVDPAHARQIAQAYDEAEHTPNHPAVQQSYKALMNETRAQYNHLVSSGYKFEFYPEGQDPYPRGPRQALEDLAHNKHLYVYPTSSGFGSDEVTDHPLLLDSGVKWDGRPVTYNDLFRAVHDVYGHAKEGVGFRADGEENAWLQHSAMFSDMAKPAMTAETRGQNSWVNFGPYGKHNQIADQQNTIYAPQKATILPGWVNERTAKRIDWGTVDSILENDGGTFNPDLTPAKHDHGYYCAVQGQEVPIPVTEFDDEAFEKYLDYIHLGPDEYIGAWVNNGIVYMDVSRWFADKDEAIGFGIENNQKAIWDIANMTEIDLPVTARWKVSSLPQVVEVDTKSTFDHEGRRPIIYSEEDNKIYIGSEGSSHSNLIFAVGILKNDAKDLNYNDMGVMEDDSIFFYGNYPREEVVQALKQAYDLAIFGSYPYNRIAFQKVATWTEIMQKAQRLRDNGQVQVNLNVKNHVIGTVRGDHGVYNTEIWRDDPNSGTISLWNCDCPWSEFSWGRTRQWKKYEGRPCAHTLALYWTALGTPLQDEEQQTIPGTTPVQQPPSMVEQQQSPLDLPNALEQTVQPAMPQSQPLTPQQGEQMTIAFPGALSKWRKQGQFVNGDYVRTNTRVDGMDDRGTYYVVPRNTIGEVIWSDDEETIVIFSIESSYLGPHNVKVTAPTEAFTLVPRSRGTAPRRRR